MNLTVPENSSFMFFVFNTHGATTPVTKADETSARPRPSLALESFTTTSAHSWEKWTLPTFPWAAFFGDSLLRNLFTGASGSLHPTRLPPSVRSAAFGVCVVAWIRRHRSWRRVSCGETSAFRAHSCQQGLPRSAEAQRTGRGSISSAEQGSCNKHLVARCNIDIDVLAFTAYD